MDSHKCIHVLEWIIPGNIYTIAVTKYIPYLGLHNAHPLLALKISRKKLVRVYNARRKYKN